MYFGPVTNQPSWMWVGGDIAAHLGKTSEIRYFRNIDEIAEDSLVFWVKCPPKAEDARKIDTRRLAVMFFPVDCFQSEQEISDHQYFIDRVRLVCLHAHSLAPYFPNSQITFVDHYNKYGVCSQERRPDGRTLLWIGAFQYVPYILNGLNEVNWPTDEITLLTNPEHAPARAAAGRNASLIGINDFEQVLGDSGIKLVAWSEESQRAALLTCEAAFDIKYLGCFNQLHKPPTKLQKYLASGIPCAINKDFPGTNQLTGALNLDQLARRPGTAWMHPEQHLRSSTLSEFLSIESVAEIYMRFASIALEQSRIEYAEEVAL